MMKIRNKLLLSFGTVLLIVLLAFLIVYSTLQDVSKSYFNLANTDMKKLQLAHQIQFEDLALTDAVRGVIIEPDNTAEREKYNQFAKQIDQHIKEVTPMLDDSRTKKIFYDLNINNQKLVELETQMMELAGEDRQKTLAIFHGEYADIRAIFSSKLEEFKQIETERITKKIAEDEKLIRKKIMAGAAVFITALFAGILIAIFISKRTTRPLWKIANKLEELARNKGDLTARIHITNKDEIGKLATAFNRMLENLQKMMLKIKETTDEVSASALELSEGTKNFAESTEQITMAVQDIASGAGDQGDMADESSHAVNNIANEVQKIASSSSFAAESALTTSKIAEEGNKSIVKAVKQMEFLQKSVDEAFIKIEELGKLTDEIKKISDVMANIAEQTNLLALNAAIEAARAGEQGKGFAVVATEVRNLAEESKQSAIQINEMIQHVLSIAAAAVENIDKGRSGLKEGKRVVDDAGRAFHKILTSVEKVTCQIQEVSSSVQQMSTGADQVAVSIGQLADIAKKSSAHSQNVAASTEEQLAAIEEFTATAENLSNVAKKLRNMIGEFNV
ncbi:MAG: hypothetical protein C6W54_06060 [Bacillaceae bacterium]|nr:MAG: hypothetical protein C6W54_06060 [Bacillaceae bacterium]